MAHHPRFTAFFTSGLVLFTLVVHPSLAALCDGISQAQSNPVTSVRVASGLTRPIFVTAAPQDTTRLFILEQDGKIKILNLATLQVSATPFLDIGGITRSPVDGGGNEQGLLGMAFHPDYAANGWVFIYHTDNGGTNNILARYTRSATNPNLIDAATRQVVLTLPHPTFTNHNGGMMAFGPDDGFLYLGTGDGGGSCDAFDNAQKATSNLGKLLRLNVNALPYTIPADNPFRGAGGINDEVWALGLRNPWRWSFDRTNSDLYIADVGQSQWEELNFRPGTSAGGENYGWDKYEGPACPNPSCGSSNCSVTSNVLPILSYNHDNGNCSITGGYVYRGCRMPDLAGTYFYADYCSAQIHSLRVVGGVPTEQINRTTELAPGGGLAINSITSFGEDARGELFVLDQGGEVFKIVPVLPNLEVSGRGATPFLMGPANWTWEDLKGSSSHPITAYRVFRSSGNGSGIFTCIHQSTGTSWTGGDPLNPSLGEVFSYLVVAVNAAGEQASPGTSSSGSLRTLSNASCP